MVKVLGNIIFQVKNKAYRFVPVVQNVRRLQTSNIPVKEVTIPVPWGHLAGRLWGDDKKRPVLALHGWQENCGAWEPLVPLLVDKLSILAVDLPGHGLSSWYSRGMSYDTWDVVRCVKSIKEHFEWDKVSVLGHSMGSVGALRYTGLYPDNVDFFIAVENLVYEDVDIPKYIQFMPYIYDKRDEYDAKLTSTYNNPCQTKEEIYEKWHEGTKISISRDKLHYIVERGVVPSTKEPNKYTVTRDGRLKFIIPDPQSKEYMQTLMSRQKQPLLYLQGSESHYKLNDEFCMKIIETVRNNNPNFEHHFVKGTHHIHINNPEVVAPMILDFLKKHNFVS